MPSPDLDEVLAEYMLRIDRGERPDRAALVAAHPEWADALREYFDGCDSLDQFTGGRVTAHDPTPIPTPLPGAGAPWPRPFGAYELLAEIGRGGMGAVYKARHLPLNRTVALKMVLAPGFASPAELERFRREAEAVARLDHPNIVPVYETGASPDGHPFFAMKWFAGGTLREARLAGRFGAAAKLMGCVARAVHHAHQRGIIHRDLKPSNIFLGADGAPAVGDFGLAKWAAQGDTPRPDLTHAGTAFGTPGYMAPEQAAGAAQLTTATDVYALGAILYELLVGRPPYSSDTPVGALVQMLLGDPARPRTVNRAVPGDLEVIALKCLEREPHRRYASAAALADDLDRWGRGEPILARPTGALGRARKWAKRHPAIAALTVAVFAVITAGAVGVLAQWQRATVARDAAELARQSEAEQAAQARHALALARRAQAGQAVTLADHEWGAGRVVRAGELLDGCPEEYRCWEWSYLKRRFRPPAHTLVETREPFYAVAFSPDGKRLVAAGADRTVRVWAVDGWKPIHALTGHTDRVLRIAVGPGGAAGRAATASADGTVRVWDLRTGQPVVVFRAHGGAVRAVAFAPDGGAVASGGEDRTVRVWGAADGRERFAVPLPAVVTALAFVPGRLAVGAADGRLDLLDAGTGKVAATTLGHRGGVWGIAVAPDGRFASTSADQTVKLWDRTSGQLRAVLVGHQRDVVGAEFDRTGRGLVTTGHDGSVRVWDVAREREEAVYRGHRDAISWVAVHPDGRWLATAGQDGRVMIWDRQDRQDRLPLAGNPVNSVAVAVSPNGARVVAAGSDGRVRVWPARAPAGAGPEFAFAAHTGAVEGLDLDSSGARLVTGGADGTGKVWNLATRDELFALRGHTGRVRAVAFDPAGGTIASASQDGTVRLWDATTGAERWSAPAHEGGATCVAFAGRRIVSGGADRTLRAWDAATGREVWNLKAFGGPVWGLAVSPDGRLVTATAAERVLRVWDAATGQQLGRAEVQGSEVLFRPAFSPDGRRLAVGCSDRTIKLFDPDTCREVFVLQGQSGEARGIGFSGDGTVFVSAGANGELQVWPTDPPFPPPVQNHRP